ncbi:MAG: UDP-N-acetylglucosamine 2-epimerase (non-hydrolyzing) [Candidatus Caenarcaniphilales bacterium]|nr:UDP-N-acetylglucosamine 2-epimerase (non-hydrolyzing) [Candidatus Caenarcaniphilales bacterium]
MDIDKKIKIICVAGTRPEFIKVFPVYKKLLELQENNRSGHIFEIKWLNTCQHKDLTVDLENFFEIKPDFVFNLENMPDSQDLRLAALGTEILWQASQLFEEYKPDLVLIQGDTLSAQQCALAAFYLHIKVGHIEAGIRTNDINAPFPEELARRIISQVSILNFTPGKISQNTLEAEKIMYKSKSYNFYTGNTVVDTLDYSIKKIDNHTFSWQEYATVKQSFDNQEINLLEHLRQSKKYILVTAHRRENSEACKNLAKAIHRIATKFQGEIEFIISVHKNPNARVAFEELYGQCLQDKLHNIKFFEAVNYPLFLKLMANCFFIVTDSGGIQEEAPYLSKPVLIFRNETERTEGIEYGLARLIGTQEHMIHGCIMDLITDTSSYESMIKNDLQPYGDGLAASRIADVISLYFKK